MAKKKISGLPAGSALNGTELVPIVQTGTTKRITTQDIANLGNASGVEGSGTIGTLAKFTASSTIGDSLLKETANAIGFAVTPKAWGNNNKVIETTFSSSLIGRSDFSGFGRNFFYNSGDDPIYSNNGFANAYIQSNGEHLWINSASGTAGNTISFTQPMTLTSAGNLGLGKTAPLGILHLYKASATTRMVIDGDAAQNRIITYRTGGVQRFGFYVNNTAESGANAGSDFAIRAYSDTGTLLSTPLFIKRSTGDVGIGTITPINVAGFRTLTINGTSGAILYTQVNGVTSAFVSSETAFSVIGEARNKNVWFATNNTIRGGFFANGNFAVNTTTDAGYKLDVNGTARVSGNLDVNSTNITLNTASSLGARMNFISTSTNGRQYQIGSNFIIGNGEFSIFDATSGVERLSISATGAATFSGQVNIGNPVNAAIAVASTHKVTIVIGGVTYYLLASNV
jgi:hypothetical protein